MSHSSKHHHRHRSSAETKSQKFWKSFLTFILFLSIAATSLLACARIAFVSPKTLVSVFCSDEYVTALQADVADYARDLCLSASVSGQCVDEAVTFDSIYQIEYAYSAGSLGASEQYTETTYLDYIDEAGEQLKEAVSASLQKQGITLSAAQQSGLNSFVERFTNYLQEAVEFPYMEQLKTVLNIGGTAVLVAAIVFGVISILLALIVGSMGSKTYRALRNLVYALSAAALLDISLVGGVLLVGCFKSLVIYPAYLADAAMHYVNICLLSVSLAALILETLAIVLITIIWKIKRDDNA